MLQTEIRHGKLYMNHHKLFENFWSNLDSGFNWINYYPFYSQNENTKLVPNESFFKIVGFLLRAPMKITEWVFHWGKCKFWKSSSSTNVAFTVILNQVVLTGENRKKNKTNPLDCILSYHKLESVLGPKFCLKVFHDKSTEAEKKSKMLGSS